MFVRFVFLRGGSIVVGRAVIGFRRIPSHSYYYYYYYSFYYYPEDRASQRLISCTRQSKKCGCGSVFGV